MAFVTEETIDTDVGTVWRDLTTPALMNRWMDSIEGLRTSDGGPLSKDSVLLFNARGAERTSCVREHTPHMVLALQSTQGSITADYRYRLRNENSRTLLSLEIDCRGKGISSIVAPIICWIAWMTDRGQLKKIKQVAEADSDDSP